jgi:hypothetical protein
MMMMIIIIIQEILTLEDGTDRYFRNAGKE